MCARCLGTLHTHDPLPTTPRDNWRSGAVARQNQMLEALQDGACRYGTSTLAVPYPRAWSTRIALCHGKGAPILYSPVLCVVVVRIKHNAKMYRPKAWRQVLIKVTHRSRTSGLR